MKKALVVLATAGAAIGFAASPSSAAPNRDVFETDCGSAGTFEFEVNGNGNFTPARDTGSTRVFVPISFQNNYFKAVAPNGDVLFEDFDESVEAKGKVGAHNPRTQITCSYGEEGVLEEEEEGFPAGTHFTFSGEVTGYLTPAR